MVDRRAHRPPQRCDVSHAGVDVLHPDGVAVLLPYGPQRDWIRNLESAGGGRVKFAGRTFAVDQPRVVPTTTALADLKTPWRQLMARAGIDDTLLLRRAS